MDQRIVVFDSESDGFVREATRIWCIATKEIGGDAVFFGPDQIEEGLEYLSQADILVAHNFLGHDWPLIQKLYPGWICPAYEDSLILSRLFNPDRAGGHSIENWGKIVGLAKPDHTDWTQFSEEMQVRCEDDAEINARMLRMLQMEMGKQDWSEAIRLEYNMQIMQTAQEERGILLDVDGAMQLANELHQSIQDIESELNEQLPKQVKIGTHYKAPFTKAGKLNHHVANWIPEDTHDTIMGPFTGVSFEPTNLNSPSQVNEILYANGWVPTEFNYKKSPRGGYELNKDGSYVISTPKLTEDSYDSIKGELGKQIAERRLLKHRMTILDSTNKKGDKTGWINTVRDDGRVEAKGIPMGTPTSRWTHYGVVNVPSVEALYGEQLRSLLLASEGMTLVGTDASGLEARVAAHLSWKYDDGEYARLLLEGDIHTANAAVFSDASGKVITRSAGKSIGYGLMYGASARKVASMVGVGVDLGQDMVDAFWESNAGLGMLREDTMNLAKRNGFLIGLDGRRVPCRSGHSALNTLIQSTGSLLMKYAFAEITFDPRWFTIMTMHDEMTCEMEPQYTSDHIDRWTDIGVELTDRFGLAVPFEFDSHIGENYAAVH